MAEPSNLDFVSTIFGAVFGGGVALAVTVINAFATSKQKKQEFRRDKIEEMYLLTNEISDLLTGEIAGPNSKVVHSFMPSMKAGDTQKTRRLENDFKGQFDLKKNRLEMLVEFYCDDLRTHSDDYLKECQLLLDERLDGRPDFEQIKKLKESMETKKQFLLKNVYAQARKNY